MKKISLFTLLLAVTFMTLTACGESEAERQAREQARLDSLRAVEQQKIAAMMAEAQDTTKVDTVVVEEEKPTYSISESGGFVIQVGAWRSEVKAQSFVNKWADRNYPSSYVIKVGDDATGDVWFRVRVGYFSTREAAKDFGAELASEINTGYWVTNKD